MAELRISQALTLVEADAQQLQLSQALVLVEADLTQVRISQALVLVEAEYVAPIEQDSADYPGNAATGNANTGGGAASTSPTAAPDNSKTGSPAGVGGGASSTTPSAASDNSPSGSPASVGGGAASISPSATSANSATGSPASAGGGSASTNPSVKTPTSATAPANANAGGSAASTTPSAKTPAAMMAKAGNVQVETTRAPAAPAESSAVALPSPTTGALDRTGKFTAELYDRAGARVLTPNMTLTPLQYSAKAVGGPDQAVIAVEGVLPGLWSALGWLAYSVRIKSPLGRVVWEGLIEETALTLPAMRVGLSIRDLYNRVQVQYTRTLDAEATIESLVTAWASNADSIARYGTKELKASLSDGSLAQAEAKRATILEGANKPLQTVTLGQGGEPAAELRCIGRWLTLDWQYYENDAGYITYEAEQTTEQAIGYSYTGTGIGFKDDNIHDLGMGLSTIPEQSPIVISGVTINAGTVIIDSAPETTIADQATVTSAGISFAASDDIVGTLEDWTPFDANEMIEVAGSALNDGYYWVKKVVVGQRLEVSGGTIVGEAGGPTKTITQGHHATAKDITFVKDDPGPAITLATHTKIAQRILATASWDAQDVVLLLARYGAPVDNLKISLYSEAAGVPSILLGTVNLLAIDVGTGLEWIECSLTSPVAITASSYYWIVVERDGSADDENYWIVGVSDELVSTWTAKVWNGSAWIDHPAAVDVPVQVWATVDSAVKAGAIGLSADTVTAVDVRGTTGVRVRSFSDGSKRISEEMQDLLDAGDSTAARLLAWFDAAGVLVVGVRGDDDNSLALQMDGQLTVLPQQQWEAGALPVRRWVRIMGLPPGALYEDMSPFYVESASYDAAALTLAIEPEANQNIWEMGV